MPDRPIQQGVRLAIAVVLLCGRPAFADDNYVESIAFEEVLPNEPGAWDLRGVATVERDTVEASAHAFFGIVGRLGGELEVPFVMHGGSAGLGDVGGGLTYLAIAPDGLRPAISARVSLHAPTGDADRMRGTGSTEVEGALGFAFVLPAVVVQGSAGYATGADDRALGNLSVAVRLPYGFHAFGETTGALDGDASLAAGPGLAYAFGPELFVAAGLQLAVSGDATTHAIVEAQYGF